MPVLTCVDSTDPHVLSSGLLPQANASVKDFGLVLTTVSNIVFDLVLVMMLSDDRKCP